jgi:hypothetical protein
MRCTHECIPTMSCSTIRYADCFASVRYERGRVGVSAAAAPLHARTYIFRILPVVVTNDCT